MSVGISHAFLLLGGKGETMRLWKLKEFWTVVIDLIVSAALYFGGKYFAPAAFADLKWAVIALQPVTGLLVAVFATDRMSADIAYQLFARGRD